MALGYFDAANALLYHNDARVGFTPRIAPEEDGRSLCERSLTSEKDLEYYDRSAVGEKIRQVLRPLILLESAHQLTNDFAETEFHNHLNALSEVSADDTKRQRASAVDHICIHCQTAESVGSCGYVSRSLPTNSPRSISVLDYVP